MQIKISKQYGSAQVELSVEATDVKEGLLKASIFTVNDVCTLCKCTEINLEGSKTEEGHTYIKRKCTKCGAASTLGTYKTGGAYFWKKFEHWEGNKAQDLTHDDI